MLKQVRVGDDQYQVLDQGHGPVLLLVHGFPLDHTMWEGQFDALSKVCRVIAPDLRGFGASQGAGDLLTMDGFADDLAKLLSELQIEQPVIFCGLSMGGYIAWQFYRLHRPRLAALILADTRATADSEQVAHGRRYLAERVVVEGTRSMSHEMLQRLFTRATLQRNPPLVKRTLDVMTATDPNTVAAAQRGMAERPDMEELLPQIDCPALVLCGRDDQITPPTEMSAMADQLIHATYVEIDDAGHLAPLENPGAVNHAIRQFLWHNALASVPS